MSTSQDNYKSHVWEFDPFPSDSTAPIEIDGVDGTVPEYRRGKDISITFLIWASPLDDTDRTTGGGGTYGGGGGITYGGAGGGTYGANTRPLSFEERYEKLRQFGDYAGAAAHGMSANNQPWYREQLPPVAPVDSIVVRVTPGPGIDMAPGFWALLLDYTDDTDLKQNYARITFNMKMLAEASEYPSHDAIASELSDTLEL